MSGPYQALSAPFPVIPFLSGGLSFELRRTDQVWSRGDSHSDSPQSQKKQEEGENLKALAEPSTVPGAHTCHRLRLQERVHLTLE